MLYLFTNDNEAQQVMTNASGTRSPSQSYVQLTPKSIRMAVTVIVTLPILFVYPFFQRYFVKGIMIGAIKG